MLREKERIDDLQFKGLRVIQNPEAFCFGTDAVLLADFATVSGSDKVVDLGTGSGVILLLIHGRSGSTQLAGVEIQREIADMARRSVELNGLQDSIAIYTLDIKDAPRELGYGKFDTVVCNPPYGRSGSCRKSENIMQRIARHEVLCTLEDCVKSASMLVRNGGRVAFIHRSARMFELMSLMSQNHLEPKRVRMVQPRAGKQPNFALVEAVKLAQPGLLWLPTLIISDENGDYTDDVKRIYHIL